MCKKYQEIQPFSSSDKRRMLFFLLTNVKMPTIVGIFAFMGRKKFTGLVMDFASMKDYWHGNICLPTLRTLPLTYCILLDTSTVIYWMSPSVILGVSSLFCRFNFI